MDSTNKDYILYVLESVKANSLASKISNIDGKILPRRYTTYQEPLKDAGSSKSNISNVKDKVDTIRIRIIIGWNQNDVGVAVIHQDPQVIHTRFRIKADMKEFFCSFVYAFNKYIHRRPLWNGLCLHTNYINNRPWCLLGDFNAPLYVEDTSMGSSSLDVTMREFKECVENMEVMDVQSTGLQYTWNQKPKGKDGILRKLDRVLANLEFLDVFMSAHAVLNLIESRIIRLRFKVWFEMRGWRKFLELDKVQTDLDSDPSNLSLREKEAETVADFNEALLMEEKFPKQKAKITWLKEGDSNTAYFHKVVKSHVSRSRIYVVTDAYGTVHHSTKVAKGFINHYEIFLGQPGNTSDFNTDNLFPTTLNESEALNMVSSQEVKSAMFSMGNDNSPGPDGFTTAFFKDTWDIIGVDVIKAVNTPARVTDYRPISCCNVLFKCISKIIAYRLKGSLKRLGKRGLRKGDPLLPYLFTLIMEVFTLMLKRRVNETSTFTYLAKVIKDALDDFKDASCLNPSMPKSKAYFCNVINYTKLAILNILPFEEDRLPVKYLGVPLVSSRLISGDCKELIDKVQNRVNDWKNKSLLIAGRLQLIQFVLSSMHVYWASVFMLPSRVLLDIEQVMRGFLWSQDNTSKGKVKVAWDVVCLPKIEGGLGIRRLDHFNKDLMVSHVWKLLSLKESLWVKMTFMWFDKWCVAGPLSNIISSCDIIRAGFSHASKVRDCIQDGLWIWPNDLLVKYPILNSIPTPVISDDKSNSLEWRCRDGMGKPFSVHNIAGLAGAGSSLASIITHLLPISKRKSSKSCIGKLVVAAAAYFIWRERNSWLFNKVKQSVTEVVDCILSNIRLKLLSCRFKKSRDAIMFAHLWEIPISNLK
nr:hypothetical protein [Tanacetum cinerariifolium]